MAEGRGKRVGMGEAGSCGCSRVRLDHVAGHVAGAGQWGELGGAGYIGA